MAKGKGRQKIENDTNRQVTFSKRRGGVFKKSTAFVIFSPSNKAHSFVMSVTNQSPSAHNNPIVRQSKKELNRLKRAHQPNLDEFITGFRIVCLLVIQYWILQPARSWGPLCEDGSSKLAFPYKYGCPPDFVPEDDDVASDGGKDRG